MPTYLSSSRTIPRHSIPRVLRYSRAIKRYSVMWCNLGVVGAVWPMVGMAAMVADDV